MYIFICACTAGSSDGASVSEETRSEIDAEVKRLTDGAYDNAMRMLKENEDKLHVLAKLLIERETLSGDEIREVLGLPPLKKSQTFVGEAK